MADSICPASCSAWTGGYSAVSVLRKVTVLIPSLPPQQPQRLDTSLLPKFLLPEPKPSSRTSSWLAILGLSFSSSIVPRA